MTSAEASLPKGRESRLSKATGLLRALNMPRWAIMALSVIGLSAFFALTAVGNRSEADDAFGYARDIEHSPLRVLIGPQNARHFLFLPIFRGLYIALRWAGLRARAYDEVRFAGAVLAACAVVLMAVLLSRRLGLSRMVCLAGAACLAVSHGFWRYADETEVYSIATLLMLVICWMGFATDLSDRACLATAAVAALGVLIDSEVAAAAFVAVPVVLVLRRHYRRLTIYLTALILLLAVSTVLLYRYAQPMDESYIGYVLVSTAPELNGVAGSYGLSTWRNAAVGFAQTITAGNVLFAYPSLGQRLRAAFPVRRFALAYAAERANAAVRVLAPIFLAALVAVALWLLLAIRSQPSPRFQPDRDLRRKLIAFGLWFVGLAIVLTGRDSNPEAWILVLPAFWALVAALVFERMRTPVTRRLVVLLPVFLLAFNGVSGYWIMQSKANDAIFLKARWLLSQARPGDGVLTADNGKFGHYLQYYSRANVQCVEGRSARQLQHLYDREVNGARHLYATGDVFNPPWSPYLDARDHRTLVTFGHSIRPSFVRVVDDQFGGVFVSAQPVVSTLERVHLPKEDPCF